MSAGWVAGSVRARAMTRRRLGPEGARRLASVGAQDAVVRLSDSTYGHDVEAGQDLGTAERAVLATLVWNARVLGGWVPLDGVRMLRALAQVAEAVNIADHVDRIAGRETPAPLVLGGLATAWPRLARCTSLTDLRRELGTSAWGDPGGTSRTEILLAVRAASAARVATVVPGARPWAAGALALLVARRAATGSGSLPDQARASAARVLGRRGAAWAGGPDPAAFAAVLPSSARWVLSGVTREADLWTAEARWWARVEHDAHAMVRLPRGGPPTLVGAIALLTVDAWRARAALEAAPHGADGAEAFDALA